MTKNQRNKTIMIRLSEDEKHLIEEYTKDHYLVTAAWIRQLILNEVKNG